MLVVQPGDAQGPARRSGRHAGARSTLPKADPKYKTTASTVDRSKGVPITDDFPSLKFPALQRATLSNGTKVILAERHDIPVVQMSYMFGGGYASDQGKKLGTSGFAMGMLDEGAGDMDALAFGNRAEALGANLGASASLDGATAYLSALKEKLDPSLDLFATMLRNPRYDQAEIDRVRATWIAGIKQEKAQAAGRRDARAAAAAVRRQTIPTRFPSAAPAPKRRSPRSRATTWSPSTRRGCVRTTRRW